MLQAMEPKLPNRIALVLLCCLGLAGCRPARTACFQTPVDPRGWQPDDTVRIAYTNTDTTGKYDIGLFIAWESRIAAMRYDSVGIRISVVTPDSLRFTEQVRLQDSAHGEGDFREWHTPYRSHARLKHIGEYVFSFVPSQATDGLRAIGMEITPTEHGKR